MEAIKTQLIFNPEHDQNKCSHTNTQADNIDDRKKFIPFKIPEGDL